MGKGSALFQRHPNISISSIENGDACTVGWFTGGDGPIVGQSGGEYHGRQILHISVQKKKTLDVTIH